MTRWGIYGAYGYSGSLVAQRSVELGLSPVLLGRDAERLRKVGNALGLEVRPVSVTDVDRMAGTLGGLSTLLNCAGPFVETAGPLMEACFASGIHYLDIGGEIDVLEMQAGLDDEAAAAGVVLMPAVGFDVAPSDCLAVDLVERLPTATSIVVAFDANTRPSAGSVATGLRGLEGAVVRRNGSLREVPVGSKELDVDFGFDRGWETVSLVRWGDAITAHISTGVENIEIYAVVSKENLRTLKAGRYLSRLLNAKRVSRALIRRLTQGTAGPSETEREGSSSWFYVEARDDTGATAAGRLRLPHAYTISAWTSVEAARRVSLNEVRPGFNTPGTAFGLDFLRDFEDVEIEHVA